MRDVKVQIEKLLQLPVAQRPQRIAELVHRLQVDKSNRAYIDHPRRVAENVSELLGQRTFLSHPQDLAVAAAWLHDVVEDSGDEAWPKVSSEDLLAWGIPAEAVEAVKLLTRDPDEKDKDAYYLRINENPLARLVKIADVADNCNEERIRWVEEAGGHRSSKRYAHALEVLNLSPAEREWFESRIAQPAELDLNNKQEEKHD